MREEIMKGNISQYQSMLAEFTKYTTDNMKTIGQSIAENLIDQIAEAGKGLKDAQEQVSEMTKVYGGGNYNVVGTDTNKKDNIKILEDTPLLKKESDGTYTLTDKVLKKGGTYGGYGIDSKDGVYNIGAGYVTADPKYTKYIKLDTGGLLPAWGSEGKMAMLHEKEIVLNKGDTANFLKAIDFTRQIVSSLPKIDFSKFIPKPAQSQPSIEINMPITIENIQGGEKGANDFFKIINTKLKGKGGYSFNV
jgi:hypothetical protein